MTVEEMLSRISARELAEWHEKYKRDPFGGEWLQTAMICRQVSAGSLKRQDGKPWSIEHFWPVKFIRKLLNRPLDDDIAESIMRAGTLAAAEKPKKKKK